MTIDPSTTALLVVDILQGADGDTVYGGDLTPAEERYRAHAKQVVDACRAAQVPVLFTCDAHLAGIDHELKLWGEHGMVGKTRPNPALKPGSSDLDFIITKRRYSGFFGTSLDTLLRELKVDTLIAVGEDTNICVLHTLADAYFLGYETIVVEDATRTFLCGTQEAGIEHCVKCYGSTIVSADEIVAALA
jgi:nicotinamidase-related amidase